jgi:NAD(P)-dependent dehydrogenase (short-subunit alcohol dehydrogenase family)
MLGLVALPATLSSTAYVASKHAVMGVTKTDGTYYANKGIRINAICPGYVETPLLKQAADSGAMAAEFVRIPAGRLAKMEEIASAIVFLASPMSSYMVGAGLVVDGYVCKFFILRINLILLFSGYTCY